MTRFPKTVHKVLQQPLFEAMICFCILQEIRFKTANCPLSLMSKSVEYQEISSKTANRPISLMSKSVEYQEISSKTAKCPLSFMAKCVK